MLNCNEPLTQAQWLMVVAKAEQNRKTQKARQLTAQVDHGQAMHYEIASGKPIGLEHLEALGTVCSQCARLQVYRNAA